MGKRARARGRVGKLTAATSSYDGLELRGALSPKTRSTYAALGVNAAGTTEDLWQRRVEFLFERLAVAWELDGVRYTGERELLGRLRAASAEERRAVRDALRAHLADLFPEVEAP